MTKSSAGDSPRREVTPSDRMRRSPATEGEPAGDDFFVLDLDTGRYYSLGEVGSFVWQRLDGNRSLAEIADEVTGTFAVEPEQAQADVLEFVGRLDDLGLLAAG